jgi:hypothetical protein
MTAIELQSELLREISPIAEDEGLMRKVIGFVRKLVSGRDATHESDKEIRTNLRHAFAEDSRILPVNYRKTLSLVTV